NPSLESIQRLTKALGASIGTVFTALEGDPASQSAEKASGENLGDILLIEDNPRDVELALAVFKKARLTNRVQVIRDGSEALDFLFCRGAHIKRAWKTAPQLILLALHGPRVNGLDLL